MSKVQVIFLINAKAFQNDTIRVKLEQLTNCKVYDFKNFEEASLYANLNPELVIFSSNHSGNLSSLNLNSRVKLIDINEAVNQAGKSHIFKYSNLKELIATI